ncbi:MAG: sulfatase [Bryobacterales bacterium]|nr:sulfatase [Bryobacterales bacterium]
MKTDFTSVITGFLLRALPAFLLVSWASAQQRPNVLFILVDDMGWADLEGYGSDLHRTPRIDALADQGMRFTSAYSASPVCSPTRASIMTGKHPAKLHMTIWREAAKRPPLDRPLLPPITRDSLPHDEVTIAEVLHDAGYMTAHVGKWHLGTAEYYPQTQGFDYNVGGTLWGAPQTFFYPYSGSQTFSGLRYVPHLGGGQAGEYLTDRLTSEAIRILRNERDRPFFLHLAFHTVHTPIEGKPATVDRYRRRIREGMLHRNPHYAAMVHALDENVGRVLDTLDDLGVADDTLVILTSDNGGYVNRFDEMQVTDNTPLRSGKGSLYEGGIRVPAIVRWPGVTQPGAESDVPISSIDYYRTILSVAGLPGDREHNRTVDGIDLTPLLRDPDHSPDRAALYFHYPHYYATTSPVSALRVGRWKLLRYYEDSRAELYDLADDLGERSDLAGEKPEIVAALTERLEAWWGRMDAQHPSPRLADR